MPVDLPSVEELLALARKQAEPVDFDALIRAGVLKRVGAWYEVHGALPDHVAAKVSTFQLTTAGKPTRIKIRSATKRAQRLVERLESKLSKSK